MEQRTEGKYRAISKDNRFADPRDRYKPKSFFAEITTPLVYGSYEQLLLDFKETPGARRASTKIGSRLGSSWRRVEAGEFSERRIASLIIEAQASGFMTLGFEYDRDDDSNNEITFERVERYGGNIASVLLEIPSYRRKEYTWVGGHIPFGRIYGILRINPQKT